MGRIMGIDYGLKRIGLAVTDPLQMFASPLTTVSNSGFYDFIDEYLKNDEVDAFVIGYPVMMNNKPGEPVSHINPFIKKLKATFPAKQIILADERFTSKMAFKVLIDGGAGKKVRRDKSMVDKISASIILQSYLDKRANMNKIKIGE